MMPKHAVNYFIRHSAVEWLSGPPANVTVNLLTAVCFIPLVLRFQWVYFRLLLRQNLLELVLNGFRQFVYLTSLQRLLKKSRHLSGSLQELALATAPTSYVSDANSSRKAARTYKRIVQSGRLNWVACDWCDDASHVLVPLRTHQLFGEVCLIWRYVWRIFFAILSETSLLHCMFRKTSLFSMVL